MRTHIAAVALGAGLLFPSVDAEACSCLATDVIHSYENADHAFVGKILRSQPRGSYVVYEVLVKHTLKSCLTEGQVIQVGTPNNTAACGTSFPAGQTWLMYANDFTTPGGRQAYMTNQCLASMPLSFLSTDDIDFLINRPLDCPVPECADGSQPLSCLVDPCTQSSCGAAGATCEPNYCGGCTAEWYDPFGYAACQPW